MQPNKIIVGGHVLGVVHGDSSGVWACPVCGCLAGADVDFPYHGGDTGLGSSWDICDCGIQYGLEDFKIEEDGLTKEWDKLRDEWLAKTPVTDGIRAQLRNIGIELP